MAREAELAELAAHLRRARSGDGLLCFVSGEGGAGKTTLVTQFTELAQAADPDLVVAIGQCDAQSGIGDAYLPFREILHALTGNLDGTLAQGRITDANASRLRRLMDVSAEAVVNLGPSLLGVLIPGGALLANMGKFVASRSPMAEKLHLASPATGAQDDLSVESALDQGQIFEQYLKVLRRVSESAPLLLVVDDLQWADPASIGLLFRLGRRLEGSRILVVGIYRPSDVTLGRDGERHPLEALINEMKRYHGDIELNLDVEGPEQGQAFVDDYLDQQDNRLGPQFRAELHRHTGGHPLFTVEVLRSLQERGELVRDPDGAWVAPVALDWSTIPSRVEGVVEERLSRVPEELRRSLTIAALEGEQFTAEVVAQVQGIDLRPLVRDLSDTLQKRHRLVRALGVEHVDGRRISRYSFSHQTMQQYLVNTLDEVEASFLHEDVGRALQDLYADSPEQVVVQLAHHFDRAELAPEALQFLSLAGARARRVSANDEAVRHYRRALHWATTDEQRFGIIEALTNVYRRMGDTDARGEALAELEEVVARSPVPAWRAKALLLRAWYEEDVGHYPAVKLAAQEAAELFRQEGDLAGEARALIRAAWVSNQISDYAQARETLARALELSQSMGRADLEGQAFTALGIAADLSGDWEASLDHFTRAYEARQRDEDNPEYLVWSMSNLGAGLWRNDQPDAALEMLERALELARELAFRPAEGIIRANMGMVLQDMRDLASARVAIEEALEVNRDLRNPYAIARCLGLLGGVQVLLGQYSAARTARLEALEVDREVGDRQDESFQLRALAELALETGAYQDSERGFAEAIEVAVEAHARDAHADCLLGMARLRLATNRPIEALEQAGAGEQLADELHDSARTARAALLAGHAHEALGDLVAARASYRRALDLGVDFAQPDAAASLARLELHGGDEQAAADLVAPVVDRLLAGDTAGTFELFRALDATGEVLSALGSDKGHEVLALGRDLLARHATGVEDARERSRFLERVQRSAPLLTQ